MSRRLRTTAIALTAAVAVSSIAYGLGSQRGDGTANALGNGTSAAARDADRGGPFRHHHRPGSSDFADRLGVSDDKLQAALEDIRADRSSPDDHEAELAQDLAAELGIAADRVSEALENFRGGLRERHDEMTEELAAKLGVEASELRAAFDEMHDDGRRHRGPRGAAAALARELGIDAAKVRQAFRELRDELGPPPRRDRAHDVFGAGLADELGVTESELRDAFERVHEAKRNEFARELAERLDISVDKVEDAMGGPALPHHHWGRGRP